MALLLDSSPPARPRRRAHFDNAEKGWNKSMLTPSSLLFSRRVSALLTDPINGKAVAFDLKILALPDSFQFFLGKTEMEIYYAMANVAGKMVVMLMGVAHPFAADAIKSGAVGEVDAVKNPFVHKLVNGPENRGPAYGSVDHSQTLPEFVGRKAFLRRRQSGEFLYQYPSRRGASLADLGEDGLQFVFTQLSLLLFNHLFPSPDGAVSRLLSES
jgi:hypothetical protein